MMHLTRQTLGRLLDGTATPDEARALARHLEDPCPECEALLAIAGAPLDALVDHALAAHAAPAPGEAGNDVEYARIRRVVEAERRAGSGPLRSLHRRWTPVAAAAALVAVVAVGVEVRGRRSREAWDGVKGVDGTAPAISVRLSAVAVEGATAPRVRKVSSGEVVAREAALQLRLELGAAADVALLRASDGTAEVFWHERLPAPGTVDVAVDGRPAAYPLSGLAGRQRFVAVASASALTPARLAALSRSLAAGTAPGRADPAFAGVSLDEVVVTVR